MEPFLVGMLASLFASVGATAVRAILDSRSQETKDKRKKILLEGLQYVQAKSAHAVCIEAGSMSLDRSLLEELVQEGALDAAVGGKYYYLKGRSPQVVRVG